MTIKIGSRRAVSSLMAAEAKKHGIIKPRLLSTLFAPAILSKVFEKYYLLKCLSKKKSYYWSTLHLAWIGTRKKIIL